MKRRCSFLALFVCFFLFLIVNLHAQEKGDVKTTYAKDVSQKSSVIIVLKHKVDPTQGIRSMDMKIEDTNIAFFDIFTGRVFELTGRPHSRFRFRINDFNTLKYAVKGTAKAPDKDKFELPAIFAAAFGDAAKPLDGLGAKAKDETKKAAGDIKATQEKRKAVDDILKDATALKIDGIRNRLDLYNRLATDWTRSMSQAMNDARSSLENLRSSLRTKVKAAGLEAYSSQMESRIDEALDDLKTVSPSAQFDQTKKALEQNLAELEKEIDTLKKKLKESVASYEDTLNALKKKIESLEELAKLLEEFEAKKMPLQEFMEKIDALKVKSVEAETYYAFREEINHLFNFDWAKPEILKSKLKEQADYIVALRKIAARVEDLALQNEDNLILKFVSAAMKPVRDKAVAFGDKLEGIEKNIVNYATEGRNQFIYVSDKPIEFQSGRLDVCLEIFQKNDAKQENSIYQLDLEIASETKQFLDKSTGVFFCNLSDESYNLEDRSDGKHIIKSGTTDWARANFGAMIHYGRKIGSSLALALSLGLTLSESRFQFFLGPSLALGADREIFLTCGVALGSIKRLKGYEVGDPFSGQAKDIPTDYFYKPGIFFGISYKF